MNPATVTPNWPATIVFVVIFAFVTAIGFLAGRWRRGDLSDLNEWGLGGRRFGPWVSWFLIGGDLYTAYTVIAVPALVYASGAFGLFAVPYTILIYPLLYITFPKLWAVTHKRGYVTGADFVAGRYGNRWLGLAIALTGIVATMPYIALQLVGMEKAIQALGFPSSHLPLTIAFAILAIYTYSSGLRAPAMIAFVKDIMIYIFVIAAVIIVPIKLGGYGVVFDRASALLAAKSAVTHKPAGILLAPSQIVPFMTLAAGSALALFMYPSSMTAILSASSPGAIRRNAFMLPAYSLVLGLIAIMGFMALAAGITVKNPQDSVPQLFLKMFPGWFAGFAFAGIAVGRAGAGRCHEHRRRQHVHPQRVEALRRSGDRAGQGGVARQIRQPRRQDRRASRDPAGTDDLRHRPAVARRRVDGADLPGFGVRPVHPLVPWAGAARRPRHRHRGRDVPILWRDRVGPDARRLGHDRRIQRLHRAHPQHRHLGGAVAAVAPTPRTTKPSRPTTTIGPRRSRPLPATLA